MDNCEVHRHVFTKLGFTVIEKYDPGYWGDKQKDYKGHFTVVSTNGSIPSLFFELETAIMCGIADKVGHGKEESPVLARAASRMIGVKTNY